jgi:curli biogenesis system outer membrane secretion channel CsgG
MSTKKIYKLRTIILLSAALFASSAVSVASAQDTHAKSQRIFVTIYEMRSSIYEIAPRAATDMFTAALFKSKKFRVLERQRISEGVARERDLNGQGITTGDIATKKVKGASVIFEATISEVNAGASSDETGVSLAGLQLGKANASDSLGIDVRVLDASNGEVLDVINVRKSLKSSSSAVSGIGALVDNVLAVKGKSTGGFTPELSNKSSTRQGVDETLRALIEDAVNTLAQRSAEWEFD